MSIASYRLSVRTIKNNDGSLLATYVEEKPFENVTAPPTREAGWTTGTLCNSYVAPRCHRRLLKVAVPPLIGNPTSSTSALAPMLLDLYLPTETELMNTTLTGGATPPRPDFIVYDPSFDEGVRGNAAALRRDWWSWDVRSFTDLYREELQEPSFASPLPVSSRRTTSGVLSTVGELGEMQQHYVAAFSRWTCAQLRERHLAMAAAIQNQRFEFEFSMVLQPRVLQREGQLQVERHAGSAVSRVHVELLLFESSSQCSALYATLLKEGIENIALASLTTVDSADDGESMGSGDKRSKKGLAAWISCQLKFTLTCDDNAPTATPSCSTFDAQFQRSKFCPAEYVEHANALLTALKGSPTDPALRPPVGQDNTLLDVVPALEQIIINTRVLPVVKWLRLVGAFRSVFGPVMNDVAIAPLVATRVAQFLVMDQVGEEAFAFVVTLAASPEPNHLPKVTFMSAQHTLTGREPLLFKWQPPHVQYLAGRPVAPPLDPDDGCAIAASVFEYLHQNMATVARVVNSANAIRR